MIRSPKRRLRMVGLLLLMGWLGRESLAQSRYLSLEGPDRWHIYGRNAVQLDDLDGDGIRDILVGLRSGGELYVHSGEDGSLLYNVSGGPNLHDLGWSILSPGDLDGDGLGDIVAGGPLGPVNGIIVMISTKTRKITRYVLGVWGSRLGWCLATLPDIDNDGVPEIVAGAPKEVSTSRGTVGAVHVFSGKTFKILRSFYPGKTSTSTFGSSIAVGGDVDADGFPDLLIGYPYGNGGYGSCSVYSGKSGKLIRRILGPTSGRTWFGGKVAWIGDQDGDKISDLLIGAEQPASGQTTGSVHIVSGKTGKTIWTISGKQGMGRSLASAGDIDGDGTEDILIGAPDVDNGSKKHYGLALIYSGKTRKVIFSLPSAPAFTSVGFSVGGNWDLDRDGKPEFWMGAYTGSNGGGTLRLYTAKHLSLQADRNLLSIGKGGTQVLMLDAGSQNARRLYVALGSISGTKPGIRIGSLLLPLNRDVYQDFTLTAPNNLPLFHGVSFLDLNGKGMAQFRIPAGTPSKFKALKFHHAFLVLDFVQRKVTFTSNAVPARLID